MVVEHFPRKKCRNTSWRGLRYNWKIKFCARIHKTFRNAGHYHQADVRYNSVGLNDRETARSTANSPSDDLSNGSAAQFLPSIHRYVHKLDRSKRKLDVDVRFMFIRGNTHAQRPNPLLIVFENTKRTKRRRFPNILRYTRHLSLSDNVRWKCASIYHDNTRERMRGREKESRESLSVKLRDSPCRDIMRAILRV